VAAFENRQPITEAKFINKNSWFYGSVLFVGWKPKLISEQKVQNIFTAPSYYQTG
jgi:hypothetical protein